ncbi:MAG: aspartate/tyrosine/aromatic aminotransferase [Hydrogenophilus sp.]|nr:aspartate/tyrosine/aromatic aminotransferase [Hydrogenophilus sp.]
MPPSSLFAAVAMAPRDPILGLNEAFALDPRPRKVNLGVGVYYDENGQIPLLDAVRIAEQRWLERAEARGYQPIEGASRYCRAVQHLLFGADHPLIAEGRLVTAQSLGGTGALKIGADLLKRINPTAQVLIPDPSWENHRALFEAAGFSVGLYRYFDSATGGVDFTRMVADLDAAEPGTIVLLHGCCHNPTGADLTSAQWSTIVDLCQRNDLIPFIDLAYQGFADGLEQDVAALHPFVERHLPTFIATSFSKNFSLYGERVGALTIVTASSDESARLLSQLKRVIRTNYSNPPIHGAALVSEVLTDADLTHRWHGELARMRERIHAMRRGLRERLEAQLPERDFAYITAQRGLFSYTGLTPSQVAKLQSEYAIYAVSSGRICVAALNERNLDFVAEAIAAVLRSEANALE